MVPDRRARAGGRWSSGASTSNSSSCGSLSSTRWTGKSGLFILHNWVTLQLRPVPCCISDADTPSRPQHVASHSASENNLRIDWSMDDCRLSGEPRPLSPLGGHHQDFDGASHQSIITVLRRLSVAPPQLKAWKVSLRNQLRAWGYKWMQAPLVSRERHHGVSFCQMPCYLSIFLLCLQESKAYPDLTSTASPLGISSNSRCQIISILIGQAVFVFHRGMAATTTPRDAIHSSPTI